MESKKKRYLQNRKKLTDLEHNLWWPRGRTGGRDN